MPPIRRLASPKAIELLADTYASLESGYRRTQTGIKSSYDGALLLLGLLDEMRQIRLALERLGGRQRRAGR